MNTSNLNKLQKISITKSKYYFLKIYFNSIFIHFHRSIMTRMCAFNSSNIYQYKSTLENEFNFNKSKKYHRTLAEDSLDVPFFKQLNLCFNCHLLECLSFLSYVWASLLTLPLASSLYLPLFVWNICIFCVSFGVFQAFFFARRMFTVNKSLLQKWPILANQWR